MIVLGVGLVLSPNSARATVLESIGGESEEVSRPTLLVKSAEQISLLVKNESPSSSISESMGDESISSSQNRDFVGSEGNRGGETAVTSGEGLVSPLPEINNTEITQFSAGGGLVAQNTDMDQGAVSKTTNISTPVPPEGEVVAQSVSVNIPVETPSNTSSQETAREMAIPIAVEAPQEKADDRTKVVPVASSWPSQPYGGIGGGIPLEVEEPVFIEDETEKHNPLPSPRVATNSANTPRGANEEQAKPTPSGLMSAININIEPYEPELSTPQQETETPSQPRLVIPNLEERGGEMPIPGFIWPARGVLTSGFGRRWGRMHKGIDIAGPVGTPIVAAADGIVISAGWNAGGYGNLVRIRHFDGTITLYAHNSKILVRRGDYVTQGQQIAKMGSTGFSTGPHLHFEIHPRGVRPMDPLAFLPPKTSR